MMGYVQKYYRVNETNISKGSFQQRFRLTKATDFERVFRENQRSVDDLFTVLYRRNGLEYPRLGLAIAKRQVRFAVERNRLKRLIRESFRDAKQQLSDLDVVIMARRKAGASDNAVVYASLARHWHSLSRSNDD
jgi:ribonuclease P protein component